jgi:hypothetical protein
MESVLWLAELKSYARAQREFNQVNLNPAANTMMKSKVKDLFLFEERTVTGDTFLPTMENTSLRYDPVGTSTHFRRLRAFLDREFPGCWKGRRGSILTSPSSLNFTPVDFFSWEFVKDTVYREKLQNVIQLRDRIVTAAECITNDMTATCGEKLSIVLLCVVPLMGPILRSTEYVRNLGTSSV